MTKLQLALDDISLDDALVLLKSIHQEVDIVEVGTPFMMEYGMSAVRKIKAAFPDLNVLCDTKIMDAGAFEAEIAYKAGADIITVLGVTDDLTIKDCMEMAKKYQKQVMIDFICVANVGKRTQEMLALGVDIVAVHTGVDQQAVGRTPLDDLKEMKKYSKQTSVAVAGGINLVTLEHYLAEKPDIVIVGGGVLNAQNPVREAHNIVKLLKGGSQNGC